MDTCACIRRLWYVMCDSVYVARHALICLCNLCIGFFVKWVGRLSCRFAAVCIALPLPLRVRGLNEQKLQPTPKQKLHPMSVQLMNPTRCTWRGMQVLQVRIVFAACGSAIRSALPALRHGRRCGLHIWEAHGDWAVTFARLGPAKKCGPTPHLGCGAAHTSAVVAPRRQIAVSCN